MIDQFHAHLDHCEQCRTQPWNLCIQGAVLLRDAVVAYDGNDMDSTRRRLGVDARLGAVEHDADGQEHEHGYGV